MSEITIIIRTLNEEKYLSRLLLSIDQQKIEGRVQVILIDSGSSDNTLTIAKNYGCKIMHIAKDRFSFGRSLNYACLEATSPILAFISGHCIPSNRNWLKMLVAPLLNNRVQYSYGRQLPGPETYFSEAQIFSKYFPTKSSIPQDGYFCNNANSAILRSVWQKYYFDEYLTGLEDMHLAQRLCNDGGVLGYVAEASVYHLHHESWHQIQRRFERESKAMQYINPGLYLQKRDCIRYFLNAISNDIRKAISSCLEPFTYYSIIRYRFHQYIGTYVGSHHNDSHNKEIMNSYYSPYPEKMKSLPHQSIIK